MSTVPTIEEALRCAVATAKEQPSEVPARSSGWIEQADATLESGDAVSILNCANAIRRAHVQYRADFDLKGWLYDLRNAHHVACGRPNLLAA